MRIADVYPFTDEEKADLPEFQDKMEFLRGKMDEKYVNLKDKWAQKMDHPTEEDFQYQPRVVVDEDDDDFD